MNEIGSPAEFQPAPARAETAPTAPTWNVACIKAGNGAEDRFAESLAAQGVEARVPYVDIVTYRGPRKVPKRRLLLKGYVPFAVYDAVELAEVLDRDRYERQQIWTVLPVKNQARFVREMEAIESASAAGLVRSAFPEIIPGAWVRVISGPMLGAEGAVLSFSRGSVCLLWRTLGACVEVSLAPELLERCPAPPD